jgi:hypothetical protein
MKFLLLIGSIATPLVMGQWLNYPTAGIPRTNDGKPNLSAPAPRTPDGKADLSGIWEVLHNRPCPPEGCPDMHIPEEFLDIGFSLKGGLPYQPWAAAIVKQRSDDQRKDDPNAHCLPVGLVRMYTTPLFRKIVQTSGLVVILNERNAEYRQIFTDARPLPADPQPSWNGYSSGKWDGDTLVADTMGFQERSWIDAMGHPRSELMHITERFRRRDFGHMDLEVTFDDPTYYTRAFTVRAALRLLPDSDVLEAICAEGEKDRAHLDRN